MNNESANTTNLMKPCTEELNIDQNAWFMDVPDIDSVDLNAIPIDEEFLRYLIRDDYNVQASLTSEARNDLVHKIPCVHEYVEQLRHLYPDASDDALRMRAKAARNRESARLSRLKKKLYTKSLEQEIIELRAENHKLHKELDENRNKVKELELKVELFMFENKTTHSNKVNNASYDPKKRKLTFMSATFIFIIVFLHGLHSDLFTYNSAPTFGLLSQKTNDNDLVLWNAKFTAITVLNQNSPETTQKYPISSTITTDHQSSGSFVLKDDQDLFTDMKKRDDNDSDTYYLLLYDRKENIVEKVINRSSTSNLFSIILLSQENFATEDNYKMNENMPCVKLDCHLNNIRPTKHYCTELSMPFSYY